jgi:hypothetical protein
MMGTEAKTFRQIFCRHREIFSARTSMRELTNRVENISIQIGQAEAAKQPQQSIQHNCFKLNNEVKTE